MQLIPAKCPDCGADLKIPEGSSSVTCEYCGGNIIVTDVLGTTAVMQNCMMLAYAALDSKNYKDAYDHFNRAIEIDLKNPNAWFGKAVCAGMTRKLNEDSFGQMIALFENSFKYASADKQPYMKKNAAAEIVKVVRKSQTLIKLAVDLLFLKSEDELVQSMAGEVNALKEKVKTTVLKAGEYDPLNKDVSALLEEVNSGKFFESDLNKVENKKTESDPYGFKEAEAKLNAIAPINSASPQGTPAGNKKGGCSMVLFMIMIVIISSVFLPGLFHH
jgi:tetratricopeptide (TPR) repeat protein